MKNIIAFAGSNSRQSINKQLAVLAATSLVDVDTTILDLNDFELPIYGFDLEQEQGIPKNAHDFFEQIKSSDGIILSLAEHNGAYASVFKNMFDWMSRIDSKVWSNKPMLLMATSPGGRGGSTVLEIAANSFPHMGGNVIAKFSLPGFNDIFSESGIKDSALDEAFTKAVNEFKDAVAK